MNSHQFTFKRIPLVGTLLLSLWASSAAWAQSTATADWPSKPVRIVVPFAPGGSSDTLGRAIAQQLQLALKQSFVVENRAGGGGTIGSSQVSKSAPYGYTLVVSGIASHVIAPTENKVYNPMTDFTHIAMLAGPPLVLAVNATVPVKNVQEFIAYAQSTKGGLSWGSPGQGTHGHIVGELFSRKVKFDQTHISYKGAGPAVADLISGQIPAAVMTYSSANAHITSGKLRGLATTSSKRVTDNPDIPTFAELGYPELTSTTWFSLSGPPGMPADLVQKINQEVRKGMKTPTVQKQLAQESMETQDWDAARFTSYVAAEVDKWSAATSVIKVKP